MQHSHLLLFLHFMNLFYRFDLRSIHMSVTIFLILFFTLYFLKSYVHFELIIIGVLKSCL